MPVKGVNSVRALVVEFADEEKHYRYLVPRSQIEGDVTFTLTRAGAVTYPLTFGLLDADPKYAILSDDEAMGGGSLPGTIGGGSEPPAGTPTATVAAGAPSGTAPENSIHVDTSDANAVHISDGAGWTDSGVGLTAAPGAVSIGTDDPSAGSGVAGAENDAYFQNDGTDYVIWIKGAGGDTDWTDSGDTIPLF